MLRQATRMVTTAAYGKWKSPISIDLLTGSAVSVSEIKAHKQDLYYLESRPYEKGRTVLCKLSGETSVDLVEKDVNVRTRVHEYGGAPFAISPDGQIVYSNFADNRLYVLSDGQAKPLTAVDAVRRFARFEFHPTKPLLVAVCEDHTKPEPSQVETYLVTVDLDNGKIDKISGGSDFYSDPSFSPDGKTLVWREWQHTEMPWTQSNLYVASFSDMKKKLLLGGQGAVTQPRFIGDTLVFSSDKTGFQQLYKSSPPYEAYTALTDEIKGDFAGPDWVFGNTSFCAFGECVLAAHGDESAKQALSHIQVDGKRTLIEHSFLTIDALQTIGETIYCIGSTKEAKGIFAFTKEGAKSPKLVKSTLSVNIDSAYLSLAQPISCPSGDRMTHGWYYPPTSPDYYAPEGTLPPLLMRIHGGPTSSSPPETNLQISYWTSRGYAFFNLNYAGSTGHGRAYMQLLDKQWGVVDSEDAINAAQYLANEKLADSSKLAIDGGSAGGFTVLNVLCKSQVFAAGVSRYGVCEVSALALDTHKFESQYLFNLLGGTPDEIPEIYKERSALYHAGNIKSPVLVQQGTEDRVVPLNQAKLMVEAIQKNGGICELQVFEGEGHGFRGKDAQQASLERQTLFLEKYLKL
ncbi:Alpha/Beta hydrolase protein [Protomyces lactucae-debilis]|uniref:Alpha/Beta hydrolase protein n=1 Tax=Protomyces lactucae-debilis TaxID=2754530 RepID=A0A1Y2FK82_PROLT|nr:Alpha/Beta hydrolase protein [Protomyces lactucae-debilis]ORY84382.1 Alpha/Beta hydrolase protein [Protomyces lactucae-debilis]